METCALKVSIGYRVIISRPGSKWPFAESYGRFSFVSAVRPKSFDAGGLRFRNNGRQWNGDNRVDLIPRKRGELTLALLEKTTPST
jgi:hypothetical protein